MPGKDGFDTSEWIRERLQESRPFIIALTASEDPDESMRCLKIGIGN